MSTSSSAHTVSSGSSGSGSTYETDSDDLRTDETREAIRRLIRGKSIISLLKFMILPRRTTNSSLHCICVVSNVIGDYKDFATTPSIVVPVLVGSQKDRFEDALKVIGQDVDGERKRPPGKADHGKLYGGAILDIDIMFGSALVSPQMMYVLYKLIDIAFKERLNQGICHKFIGCLVTMLVMRVWTKQSWTSDMDVISWIEQVQDKKLKLKDVVANILRDFNTS
uniref:Uncharacterized protein n=1 Tax=Ditylenchus dipsaci TaxID=166011 RepID=A0A915EI06_9BILA